MYKSFRVKNFRCFKDLQINDLGRVNLIAGKNNTGKTALLEAMYILSGEAGFPTDNAKKDVKYGLCKRLQDSDRWTASSIDAALERCIQIISHGVPIVISTDSRQNWRQ